MLGKFFQEFLMFLMSGERGYRLEVEREVIVWTSSCMNALKGTVLHRTVLRHRANGKPIRTQAERLCTVPCKRSLRSKISVGSVIQEISFVGLNTCSWVLNLLYCKSRIIHFCGVAFYVTYLCCTCCNSVVLKLY